MAEVMRSENKYLLNWVEYLKVCGVLDQLLHPDPHNGPNGYLVRSLYFDSIYDRDAVEKMNGLELRRKIRMRIYEPNAKVGYLEMKQKEGDQQYKRSLGMPREDAERIIAGDLTPLLKMNNPFAAECYGLMQTHIYRPKTIVQYDRKAFIGQENKIRITFDSHIEATESSMDLFSDHLNMNPVLDRSAMVMEVKYNGFLLSYYKQLLSEVDKSKLSVSKYFLARQQSFLTRL